MRRKMRALRATTGEVAVCDAHLPLALQQVVAPANGDTHMVVRRLQGDEFVPSCEFVTQAPHAAAWLLAPQAVTA